ncbi:hypothetical protein GRI01_09055 [Lactobacillus gasseri]|nr:hypothetical protein [Lactobacillus gasseri]
MNAHGHSIIFQELIVHAFLFFSKLKILFVILD